MKIELPPEDEDNRIEWRRPESRKRAVPDYSSRGMKVRLMLLVGSLLLVLVMMEQVRDPELWRRLGFGERPAAGNKRDSGDGWVEIKLEPGSLPETGNSAPATGREEDSHPDQPDGGLGTELPETEPPSTSGPQNGGEETPGTGPAGGDRSSALFSPDGKTVADPAQIRSRLWTSVLDSLQGAALNGLAARVSSPDQELRDSLPDGSWSSRLAEIDRELRSSVTRELEQLAQRPGSAVEREVIAAELVRLQSVWGELLHPWLASSGNPLDPAARADVEFLRSQLLPAGLRRIVDRTGPARSEEGAAWLLIWRGLIDARDAWPSEQVSDPGVYRLMTMPEGYRGKPVRIRGSILGVEPLKVAANPLGISRYWILWIGTAEGGNVPACVYVRNLPAGVPSDPDRFTSCRLPVDFPAVFFKLRTYTDTAGKPAGCPLLLAEAPVLNGEPVMAVTAGSGSLSRSTWIWIGSLAAGAALVSWWAFRSVRGSPALPPTPQVSEHLRQLESDPAILSDRERVAQWAEKSS